MPCANVFWCVSQLRGQSILEHSRYDCGQPRPNRTTSRLALCNMFPAVLKNSLYEEIVTHSPHQRLLEPIWIDETSNNRNTVGEGVVGLTLSDTYVW